MYVWALQRERVIWIHPVLKGVFNIVDERRGILSYTFERGEKNRSRKMKNSLIASLSRPRVAVTSQHIYTAENRSINVIESGEKTGKSPEYTLEHVAGSFPWWKRKKEKRGRHRERERERERRDTNPLITYVYFLGMYRSPKDLFKPNLCWEKLIFLTKRAN